MKTIQSILVVAAAVMLVSCGGGGYKKTKGGILYQIVSDSRGNVIKNGDFFEIQIGETVYKTGKKDTLLSDPNMLPPNQVVPMDSATLPPDFYTIFKQIRKGDSIIVRQSTDSIIKSSMGNVAPFLKKGGFIVTSYRIVNIYSNRNAADSAGMVIMQQQRLKDSVKQAQQLVKDDQAIREYLTKNNISAFKTAKGCYVQILDAGTGPKADSGKQVSVLYTGFSFDGKKFDSNIDTSFQHPEPLQFVIGQFGMIAGFQDGVMQIAKGGKAKIFVPSSLAYGAQGNPPAVKPNENLIFEMELLDIKAPPKQQSPVLPPPQQGGN
ncbi:MAG: FKBP-type peptidyl-prolyl cis-trans isomerase [Chitinophagaceae bacterium]|nr:FKBP-type peptidyl-prolyl cis-trans isomerase [Chitinophagaceae bacterium]